EWLAARRARAAGEPPQGKRVLWAYALPLALVPLLCLLAYCRSTLQGRELLHIFKRKHTLNMAQVYCFGYQQRHPEWTKSPWTEYEGLMQAHFGRDLLPLSEMFAHNRRAVLEHFAWNFHLLPAGLQLLLFNATAGTDNPDYVPIHSDCAEVGRWSYLLVGVLVLGGVLCACRWRWWWENWLRERAFGWLVMAAFVPVSCMIIATQRPRPSYLFSLSLFIMAAAGMAAYVLVSHVPLARRLGALMPLVMIAACFLVKPYFGPAEDGLPRMPVRTAVERMLPFEPL